MGKNNKDTITIKTSAGSIVINKNDVSIKKATCNKCKKKIYKLKVLSNGFNSKVSLVRDNVYMLHSLCCPTLIIQKNYDNIKKYKAQ